MAYDSTNETLSSSPTGITLKEISRCIKDYRVDTNGRTDLGMMCTSPKINKWSQYKPQGGGKPDDITILPSTFKTGLTVPIADYSEEELIENFNITDDSDMSATWSYTKTPPYRMSDFDGYYHKAEKPLQTYMRVEKGVLGGLKNARLIVEFYPKVTGEIINPGHINLHDVFGSGARMILATQFWYESMQIQDLGYLDTANGNTNNEMFTMDITESDLDLYGNFYAALFVKDEDGICYKLDNDFGTTWLEEDGSSFVTVEELLEIEATWYYNIVELYGEPAIKAWLHIENNGDDITVIVESAYCDFYTEGGDDNLQNGLIRNRSINIDYSDSYELYLGESPNYILSNVDNLKKARLYAKIYREDYPRFPIEIKLDDIAMEL